MEKLRDRACYRAKNKRALVDGDRQRERERERDLLHCFFEVNLKRFSADLQFQSKQCPIPTGINGARMGMAGILTMLQRSMDWAWGRRIFNENNWWFAPLLNWNMLVNMILKLISNVIVNIMLNMMLNHDKKHDVKPWY